MNLDPKWQPSPEHGKDIWNQAFNYGKHIGVMLEKEGASVPIAVLACLITAVLLNKSQEKDDANLDEALSIIRETFGIIDKILKKDEE